MDRIKVNDKYFRKFISAEKIEEKTGELAGRIAKDYDGKCPLFLVVINGAIIFAADLIRKAGIDSEYDCLRASSYGKDMCSCGKPELSGELPNVENRHVVIIEDIVDTGHTLKALTGILEDKNAASVEIVSLFSKPAAREVDLQVKYVGFEIEPLFIIGFGLDYAYKGRYLKDVYILDE